MATIAKVIASDVTNKDCLSQNPFVPRVYAQGDDVKKGNTCAWFLRAPIVVLGQAVALYLGRQTIVFFKYIEFVSGIHIDPPIPYTPDYTPFPQNIPCPLGACSVGCGQGKECSDNGICCQYKSDGAIGKCSYDGNIYVGTQDIKEREQYYNDHEFYQTLINQKRYGFCKDAQCDPEKGCLEMTTTCLTPGAIDVVAGYVFVCSASGIWEERQDIELESKYWCNNDYSGVVDSTTGKTVEQCDGNSKCIRFVTRVPSCMPIYELHGCSVNQVSVFGGYTCGRDGVTCTPGKAFPLSSQYPCPTICDENGYTTQIDYSNMNACLPFDTAYADRLCTGNDVYLIDGKKSSDATNFSQSCAWGCVDGVCAAPKTGYCAKEGELLMRADGKCLVSCKNGRYEDTGACGRVDVFAYNNQQKYNALIQLARLPDELFDGIKIPMIINSSRYLSVTEGGIASIGTYALSGSYAPSYITVASSQEQNPTIIHEFFHALAANQVQNANLVAFTFTPIGYYASYANELEKFPISYMHDVSGCVPNADGTYTYSKRPITGYGGKPDDKIPCYEDFADTAEWYVFRPCDLLSTSEGKVRYEYFRDEIFNGRQYIPSGKCPD